MTDHQFGWPLSLFSIAAVFIPSAAIAQRITPALDGVGTIVNQNGNRFDIEGGIRSRDNVNLFHSFEEFGLSQEQVANFLSNSEIRNILGRVIGGNASMIDGLIQVTGGSSNLYLMNPTGIVFGPNARLDVPASFTATTANGIEFGSGWFSASGFDDYSALVGDPSGFAFTMSQPGAIINAGDLAVTSEQGITLLGGTIVSTGDLTAPEGQITIATVPGGNRVRLGLPGHVLGLEIESIALEGNQPNNWTMPIASLPALLTTGIGALDLGVALNEEGQVVLTVSELPIAAGDITARDITAQTAELSASNNLTLVESQLRTIGHLNLLADNTVRVRDTAQNPLVAQAGGDLYIQGDQSIDILALNHPETLFQSTGKLSLISDGNISGDAHFASGGDFSILRLSGEPGSFVSLYDPIIRSLGDVELGDYTGVSLKVEALGSITGRNITITGPDLSQDFIEFNSDADFQTLTTKSALILRSGVDSLTNDSFLQSGTMDDTFVGISRLPSSSTDINITGSIQTVSIYEVDSGAQEGIGGQVILEANGDITVAGNIDINTPPPSRERVVEIMPGAISLAAEGNILIGGSLDSSTDFLLEGIFANSEESFVEVFNETPVTGSPITVLGESIVVLGNIKTSIRGNSPSSSSDNVLLQLEARDFITVLGDIDTSAVGIGSGYSSEGGNILISALDDVVLSGGINSSSSGGVIAFGGDVDLSSMFGSIRVEDINSSASQTIQADGGNVKISAPGGLITTGDILSFSSVNTSGEPSTENVGGEVDLRAGESISTGSIASYAVTGSGAGDLRGGSVILRALENIFFESINTQGIGGFDSDNSEFTRIGLGGDVQLFAGGVVQGIGTTTIQLNSRGKVISEQSSSTIFTRGEGAFGSRSGVVSIRHSGGSSNFRFTIGTETQNGTIGSIDTGSTVLSSLTVPDSNAVPLLPSGNLFAVDGVQIRFVNRAPTLRANLPLIRGQTNQPFTFTLRDLNLLASDGDGDNTSVEIVSINDGVLRRSDGSLVRAGAVLSQSDILVYQPPPDSIGSIDAFAIRASDGVSFSEPVSIAINAALPTRVEDLVEREIPEERPNPASFPSPNLRANLPCAPIDTGVSDVDESYTREFEEYLGQSSGASSSSLVDACSALGNVAGITGIRPAVIYANFVPTSIGSEQALGIARAQQAQDSDQLEVVLVTAEGQPFRKRIPDATRSKVLLAAQEFSQAVSINPALREKSYVPAAQQLYQWLITPLEAELGARDVENLVFIMDVGLRSLPLAALIDSEGQFLVKKYSIGLAPSLTLTDTRYTDLRDAEVLAMGASTFSADQGQNPLPTIEAQLSSIFDVWGGEQFVEQDFSLDNLREQRREQPYGIIHLATHADFQSGEPAKSFIQLPDSKLYFDREQIRSLGWNDPPVKLLVLSACRTALGDREAELGFAGLAAQTGVTSALASLWFVSQEGTLALMAEFYRQLRVAPIKAEALRQAQIAMIDGAVRYEDGYLNLSSDTQIPIEEFSDKVGSPNLGDPYYWAAFTMVGSPW